MTTLQQSLKQTWTGPGSSSLSDTVTRTVTSGDGAGAGEKSLDLTALQANRHVELQIRRDGLKLLFIKATTACTIYVNDASGGSPDGDPILVNPTAPVTFVSDVNMTNPFSVDVTDFYVTETGNAAGTLEVRWLEDSAP